MLPFSNSTVTGCKITLSKGYCLITAPASVFFTIDEATEQAHLPEIEYAWFFWKLLQLYLNSFNKFPALSVIALLTIFH